MPAPSLKEVLRDRNVALENHDADKQKFDPLTCQCCGYRKERDDSPECVCDGLEWYMDKVGGGVECQAHRFARAVSGSPAKPIFLMDK